MYTLDQVLYEYMSKSAAPNVCGCRPECRGLAIEGVQKGAPSGHRAGSNGDLHTYRKN